MLSRLFPAGGRHRERPHHPAAAAFRAQAGRGAQQGGVSGVGAWLPAVSRGELGLHHSRHDHVLPAHVRVQGSHVSVGAGGTAGNRGAVSVLGVGGPQYFCWRWLLGWQRWFYCSWCWRWLRRRFLSRFLVVAVKAAAHALCTVIAYAVLCFPVTDGEKFVCFAHTQTLPTTTTMQVRLRQPELLRPEHPAEPRLPTEMEALQLVHRPVRLRTLPRHHAGRQLEGEIIVG